MRGIFATLLIVFFALPVHASFVQLKSSESQEIEINPDGSVDIGQSSANQTSNSCEGIDLNKPEIIVSLKPASLVNSRRSRTSGRRTKKINKKSLKKFKSFKAKRSKLKVSKIKKLIPEEIKPQGLSRLASFKQETLKSRFGLDRVFVFEIDKAQVTQKARVANTFSCKELTSYLEALKKEPEVELAEFNKLVKANLLPNDTHYDKLWGLEKINSEAAWDLSQGNGVVVAIVDTGVDYNHFDLWDNIWLDPGLVNDTNNDGKLSLEDVDTNNDGFISSSEVIPGMLGYDFYDNDGDPMDEHYHGTHVAGTVAATGNNNLGVIGVAPKAKIMVLRFLGPSGSGFTTDAIDAIIWAADRGAQITNNSWSGSGSSSFLTNAFNYANSLGVISVAAAGNDDELATNNYPSNIDTVISVAALNAADQRASFSNYGPSVDIAAPGVSIYSTDLDDAYRYASGTSMASPHVAGVIAQMLGLRPDLRKDEALSIIKTNAQSISTDQPVASLIDAAASLNIPDSLLRSQISTTPSDAEIKSGSLDIYGTANGQDFASYTLGIYETNNGNNALVSISSSSPVENNFLGSLDLTNITKNAYYNLRLDTFTTDNSKLSDSKSILLINNPPNAPGNLSSSGLSIYPDKMLQLEWSQKRFDDKEITGYQIFRAENGASLELVSNGSLSNYRYFDRIYYHDDKFRYLDKNLKPGTSYTYSIKAVNAHGASSSSPSFTTSTASDFEFNEASVFNFASTQAELFTQGGSEGKLPLNRFGGVIGRIIFDNNKDMLVLDRREVKKVDMTSSEVSVLAGDNSAGVKRSFGSLGDTVLFWPVDMEYDETNSLIYVLNNFSGFHNGAAYSMNELVELDLNNESSKSLYLNETNSFSSSFDRYTNLTLDKNKNLVLSSSSKVSKFDTVNQSFETIIDFEQLNPGAYHSASSFSYDQNGDKFIYINNGTISSFNLNGDISQELDFENLLSSSKQADINSISQLEYFAPGQYLAVTGKERLGLIDLKQQDYFVIAGSEDIEDALNDIDQKEGLAMNSSMFVLTTVGVDADKEIFASTGYITDDNRKNGSMSYATPNIKQISFSNNKKLFPPGQVMDLNTSYDSVNGAVLSWTSPSFNGGSVIIDFNIYKGNDPSNLALHASSSNTYFIDNGAELGSINFYRVSAKNSSGEGELSSIRTLIIPRPAEPEPSPAPPPASSPSPAPPAPSPAPPAPSPAPSPRPSPPPPSSEEPEAPPAGNPEDEIRQIIPEKVDEIRQSQDKKDLFDLIKDIKRAEKKEKFDFELDLNNDGVINSEDAKLVNDSVQNDTSLAKVVQIHEILETSGNGKINKKAQLKLFRKVKKARKYDELPEELQLYDLDQDGSISDEEFDTYKDVLKPKKKNNNK